MVGETTMKSRLYGLQVLEHAQISKGLRQGGREEEGAVS